MRTPHLLALTTLLLVSASAAAQEPNVTETPQAPAASEPPAPPPEKDPEPEEGQGSLQLPTAFGSLEVGGRLSVREALDAESGEAWAGKLSLPAARLELTYRWKKRLRAVVEFDVQDGLKDAFVWLNLPKGFALRAGQFKVPLSLVELESTRTLPLVRRGLGREVLNDALALTGRRIGAQLEWKCSDCGLKLHAGVWQSGNVDGKTSVEKGLGLVPALRATWELGTLELGASALLQPAGAVDGGSTDGWMSGFDARHSLPIGKGELRTWAEVLVGRTELLMGTEGPLLTARALTAFRIGGTAPGKLYLEPFVMLSALDPDFQLQKDLLWEGAGGLNFGQRGRWRLQVQAELRQTEESVPAVVRTLDNNLVPRKALLLQMEVGF